MKYLIGKEFGVMGICYVGMFAMKATKKAARRPLGSVWLT